MDMNSIAAIDSSVINHPKHYTDGRTYEPWDVIIDWGLDYLSGNVVKYISRAGRKDNELQDLLKAKAYLDKKIETVKASMIQS